MDIGNETMAIEEELPESFKASVDSMINGLRVPNMIREIQIKGTMEWLETTEDGYVVKSVADNLGISCRKVAEMIVDKVI